LATDATFSKKQVFLALITKLVPEEVDNSNVPTLLGIAPFNADKEGLWYSVCNKREQVLVYNFRVSGAHAMRETFVYLERALF